MRLIDADAFIAEHCIGCRYEKEGYCTPDDTICGTIDMLRNDTPTIEAEPVVHGRWVESKCLDECFWVCSNCKFPSEALAAPTLYHFCPNCGAKMDGERKNNE